MSTNKHRTRPAGDVSALRWPIRIDLDLRDLEITEEEILADLLYPWR
jgi:hypothetical protein